MTMYFWRLVAVPIDWFATLAMRIESRYRGAPEPTLDPVGFAKPAEEWDALVDCGVCDMQTTHHFIEWVGTFVTTMECRECGTESETPIATMP